MSTTLFPGGMSAVCAQYAAHADAASPLSTNKIRLWFHNHSQSYAIAIIRDCGMNHQMLQLMSSPLLLKKYKVQRTNM